MIQGAFKAVTIFLFALAGFERAQHAQFAFNRDADHVRDVHHLAGDADIISPIAGSLAVFLERAIHHHRRKASGNGRQAGFRAVAMVLMHTDRDLGIQLDRGLNQLEHDIIGISAGAPAGLQNDRAIGLLGGGHNRQHLFHIVDVKRRQAIAILGRMVEQLAHRNQSHLGVLSLLLIDPNAPRRCLQRLEQ